MASAKPSRPTYQKISKMRLNNIADTEVVSQRTGFSIFELPEADFSKILPHANHFRPSKNNTYIKEEIDAIAELVHNKQQKSFTIVLEEGEEMNEHAANTFLKTLEEPGENVHFVFLVHNISKVLATIKSRAQCYYLPPEIKITEAPKIDMDLLGTAKKYLTCTPQDLPKFCDQIAKDKTDARGKAIAIVDAAIQLAYKSYFVTKQPKYLDRLDSLLQTYEAIQAGGHIKLQLINGML